MFEPGYHISAALLANIKRVAELASELRHRPLPRVVRADLAQRAVTLSAHTSTRIEGNPLPLTEVKRLLKLRPRNLRESEREVLNYNDALVHLNELVSRGEGALDREGILDIHERVMRGLAEPALCGRFRAEPVVVNDPRTGRTVFLPPDHGEVEALVDGLLSFLSSARGRVDPLIAAGIFHRQLVLIHPFTDGNGRTTRLATKLLLADLGIDTFPLFSFENHYNRNVTRYFAAVGAVGDYYEVKDSIEFTPWLEYFTEGIVDELLRVLSELEAAVAGEMRLAPHHELILEHLREHGVIMDRDYALLTDRARATRALDFRRLLDLGLIERRGGGRSTHYRLVIT